MADADGGGPDAEAGTAGDATDADDGGAGGRTVPVPVAVYKRVTVFSTLVATAFVVLGFTMFDAASFENSVVRVTVLDLLGAVGLAPGGQVATAGFVVVGLGCIAFGAGVYILGARFKAPDMVDGGADGKG